MASEGLTGALAAVLAGQGPSVQSCDSAPAGEPPVPVRLRKNVCYVVLAVFLSEQVSGRPPGPPGLGSAQPAQVGTEDPTATASAAVCVALPSFAKHSHSHSHLCPAFVPMCRRGN